MNDVYLVFWQDDVYGRLHLIDIFSSNKEAKKFIEQTKTEYVNYTIQCWKVKEKWNE